MCPAINIIHSISIGQAEIKANKKTSRSSGKQPMKVAKQSHTQPKSDHMGDTIAKLLISGPTSEVRPRVQVCARVESNPRLFICTVLTDTYPRWEELIESMKASVENGGCTKKHLLAIKADLAKAAEAV